MGVGTLFTAEVSLAVEPGLVVEGVALGILAGVATGLLSPSFLADLGVVLGVAAGLGVELFSLPLFLPEVGVLGVVFACKFKNKVK